MYSQLALGKSHIDITWDKISLMLQKKDGVCINTKQGMTLIQSKFLAARFLDSRLVGSVLQYP